ncbi:hypothetical protein PRA02_004710 [Salmonella enterica]|nr:hypothetical protein [Salmonella enterica]EKL3441007.1 hypothetical protein [Salmonella enterica]
MRELIFLVIGFFIGEIFMLWRCTRKLIKNHTENREFTISELDRLVEEYKRKCKRVDEFFGMKNPA